MNLVELNRALRQLRLGGMAAVLETRLRQAQAESMAPLHLISCLVADELTRRTDRMQERRRKQAQFCDPLKTLDNFDFTFNNKMNRRLVFELASGTFIARHEDALFLGPPGTGKSHLAQAIGQAVIQQGYRVFYRETHVLLEELSGATLDGTRKECLLCRYRHSSACRLPYYAESFSNTSAGGDRAVFSFGIIRDLPGRPIGCHPAGIVLA
jgi:DNA replication protein DnaC